MNHLWIALQYLTCPTAQHSNLSSYRKSQSRQPAHRPNLLLTHPFPLQSRPSLLEYSPRQQGTSLIRKHFSETLKTNWQPQPLVCQHHLSFLDYHLVCSLWDSSSQAHGCFSSSQQWAWAHLEECSSEISIEEQYERKRRSSGGYDGLMDCIIYPLAILFCCSCVSQPHWDCESLCHPGGGMHIFGLMSNFFFSCRMCSEERFEEE